MSDCSAKGVRPRHGYETRGPDGGDVPGGYDGVVSRLAKLYAQRLQTTGEPPTIAAPTNIDAHRISEAVRLQRRGMGLMGETDLITLRATDGERNYSMPIAKGDRVRLFQSTGAGFGESGGATSAATDRFWRLSPLTAMASP